MTGNGKPKSRTSYAGHEPNLRRSAPVSLRQLRALRTPFDHARCPYVSRQLKDQSKTEAQRRGEQGRGSMMIKLHRPSPVLRPKHEQSILRASFNKAWLKEQRRARLAQPRAEKTNNTQAHAAQHDKTRPMPGRER